MRFPFIRGIFLSDKLATDVIELLFCVLQRDLDINAKILQIANNEISFDVRPSHFLERNAFMPNVYVVMRDVENGSLGTIEYSLQKGPRIFLTFYCALLLVFEGVLLFLVGQLASPLLLLIPVGLITFSAIISLCGLYVFSRHIHGFLLGLISAIPKNPLKLTSRKRQIDSSGILPQ